MSAIAPDMQRALHTRCIFQACVGMLSKLPHHRVLSGLKVLAYRFQTLPKPQIAMDAWPILEDVGEYSNMLCTARMV